MWYLGSFFFVFFIKDLLNFWRVKNVVKCEGNDFWIYRFYILLWESNSKGVNFEVLIMYG